MAKVAACPKCRSYMDIRRVDGVEIDRCPRCEGIWLDRGELAMLTKAPDDFKERLPGTPTVFPCCRCGGKLVDRPYALVGAIRLDACPDCEGVFMDHGELEKVQELNQKVENRFDQNRRKQFDRTSKWRETYSSVYDTENPAAKAPERDRSDFIRKVYAVLAGSLVVTTIGALIGIHNGFGRTIFIPALIGEIILFLICLGVRRIPVVNFLCLGGYAFLSGLTLSAVLLRYLERGYGAVIWQAAAITAVIFVTLSVYVHVTRKDFSWMGGMLFASLMGIIFAMLFMMLFGNSFGMFIVSVISAITFSGYILYDTSNIILKYETDEVVSAVLDLYLDIINLFLDLLRILAKLRS